MADTPASIRTPIMVLFPHRNDLGKATMTKPKVTRNRVMELLSYDPETGLFHWRVLRHGRIPKSRKAGWLDDGYIRITIDGRKYQATHLAWLIVHGEWPAVMIDHKDGNTLNNRLANLRSVTNAENQRNKRASTGSTTGLKGVTIYRKRGRLLYRSVIRDDDRYRVIGCFKTPIEAHKAYCVEAARLFGEFARFS